MTPSTLGGGVLFEVPRERVDEADVDRTDAPCRGGRRGEPNPSPHRPWAAFPTNGDVQDQTLAFVEETESRLDELGEQADETVQEQIERLQDRTRELREQVEGE